MTWWMYVIAVAGCVPLLLVLWLGRGKPGGGMGTARDLRRHKLDERGSVKKARKEYPKLWKECQNADGMAVRVGSLAGIRKSAFLQHRDGVLVYGPTGSGKTAFVAWHLVMSAPGACLVTTTKADLLASTWLHRSKIGPVGVFDCEGLTGWPSGVRWSPLAGCKDPDVAIRRAHALAAAMPMEGTKNGDFFQRKAAVLLRCYLHAAAVGGYSLRDVRLWVQSKTTQTPGKILENSEIPAIQDWAKELAQILGSTADSSDDVISSAADLLAPLASPRLMQSLDCDPRDSFDPVEFIRNRGTLYLVSEGTAKSMAPFVSAFADEIVHVAIRTSQELPGNRHDPPMRCVFDEVNNVAPIPNLAGRLTDSGGRGVTVWCFVHSQAQNIRRWGLQGGRELAASAPVRLILPGLNDVEELEGISRLIGRRRRWVKDRTGRGGSWRDDEVMPANRIQQLPTQHALLLPRNTPPFLIKLPTVFAGRNARLRAESETEFEAVLTRGHVASSVEVPAL